MFSFTERILPCLVKAVSTTMRYLKIMTIAFSALIVPFIISTVASAADLPPMPAPLIPGPNDGRIAYMTARLLEEYHYSQHPLDMEMSEKFFDGYLESLDPRRENFLQSDFDEFAHYRTNLDAFTIGGRGRADLTPAYEIFQRFLQRLQQHVAYVDNLLKQDNFKFDTDERVAIDRHDMPYPKNLADAQHLWLQQLSYEYLQEKIGREISATNSDLILPLSKTNEAEIARNLAHHYDWSFKMLAKWDSTDVLQAYLNALTHAYDPHSDYLNTAHEQQFSMEMSLSLFGIGAQLTEDDGKCTIASLIPGGPADKSKQLKEKDQIIAVAQSNQPPVSVVDMELSKAVQLIRGPKGTQVQLTIIPADDPGARHVVTIIRDEIKLEDSEAKAQLIELPDGHGGTNRLGIINLPEFYFTIDLPGNNGNSTPKSTTADVTKLIQKLEQQKVGGIILDLRNNPGGSLEEAVKFTGLFIKDGPVVLARSPDSPVATLSDTDSSQLYDGPLVVLVNRFSASAAEIASAALQDYDRALVVGDIATHGKGTVQNLNSLRQFVWPAEPDATNDPGTVKITIRKFYRITGASTQLKGVMPDIVLPSVLSYSTQFGETSLENPLPWDTIPAVNYDKLNLVQPYLSQLRVRSNARIATNQDFIYVRQDIDELQKLQADKTATLNEHEALKERQKINAQIKARDAERTRRKIADEKIYDITLENADMPGLRAPEPMTVTNFTGDFYTFTNHETGLLETNTANWKAEVKTLPPDPTLGETEQILEDYISLLNASHTLIAK